MKLRVVREDLIRCGCWRDCVSGSDARNGGERWLQRCSQFFSADFDDKAAWRWCIAEKMEAVLLQIGIRHHDGDGDAVVAGEIHG
ncbi:hypothetical protein DEO72_LG5g1551 [Vigna unguiculata]|uniref:Uncharacterized protein n=1 Tax=Vigna unguiculata TaxID=3917 RepID=A0A4D6LZR3_VIGUN|nr:hypothetical protein DEO72_LG5g1551 [Vigna unguiculata]